ncbi:MAG: amino acid ABC transporter substrate-binding protein [Arenicellales bacterium]|nr:amino acid ABC transporter substrate-binding protein [Arenicellales bacterium]
MRAFIIAAAALLFTVPTLNAAEQLPTLEQIKKTGKIRIGYRQSEPPMSFRDNDGSPVGYSIDLCDRIVSAVKTKIDKSDVSVDYVPVNAQNRFTAIKDNKIDLLCGATTRTLSRSELVDFTQLTFVTGTSLMSLRKSPIDSLADLKDKKIAVVKGTTTREVLEYSLEETSTDAEVIVVDSAAQGFNMLQENKVDAYCSDQVVLIGLLLTSETPDRFHVSENTFSYEPFALAVRRNDADFRLVANRVLSDLYRSGQILDIYKKWFGLFSDEIPGAIAAAYQLNAIPE